MSELPFEKTAAALLTKYHRFVFWQARRSVPFPDMAEDVAQQVFVDFLAKADKWDLEKDLKPLLTEMVKRSARTVWQKESKLMPEALQEIAEFVQRELNDENETQEDRLTALRSCMQKLPEGGRRLITRYYYDGVSVEQIAGEIRKQTVAVGKAIYRVREKLRLCIEQTLKAEEHHG